jgi:hypothetical protein
MNCHASSARRYNTTLYRSFLKGGVHDSETMKLSDRVAARQKAEQVGIKLKG